MKDLTTNKKQSENGRKLIKKFRYLFAITLMIVIILIGSMFFVSELFWSYRENLELAKQLDSSVEAMKLQLEQKRNNAGKIYELTSDEKRIVNMALPDRPDHAALVEHLTSMARRSGFLVGGLNLDEGARATTNGNDVGRISVRLSLINGDYQALNSFIELVENSIMPIDVMSINFRQEASDFEMVLMVYYYR
jgi:hypothetical protein